MKKAKLVAMALSATLLVGGTFIGTKALFTDKVDMPVELTISTGDLDIEIGETSEWEIVRNGEENNRVISPGSDGMADYDNLKYGDVITKTVEVYNNGTLNAIVTLEENTEVTERLPEGIEYKVKVNDEEVENVKEFNLGVVGNKRATIEFSIEVTGGGQHNEEGSLNSDEQEQTIIDLKDSYKLSAQQQNPNHK